jgi:Ca2+-transporting ATPase
MSKRNVLINRLAAVETLGATNVICTDKTGTLTEGTMTVRTIVTAGGETKVTGGASTAQGGFERDGREFDLAGDAAVIALLEVGVLCNDASWDPSRRDRGAVGDPVEVALLVAGSKAGMERDALVELLPEEREVAFDPEVKMMATCHRSDGGFRVAVKGAPEAVLAASTKILVDGNEESVDDRRRQHWLERNESLAAGGLRILALAHKSVVVDAEPYRDLCFLGFVGLVDPPRKDVRGAIEECLSAGIRVVMLTGDQVPTARYVGREVGVLAEADDAVVEGRELLSPEELDDETEAKILRTSTFARVTPRQKLDLVRLTQSRGQVVAMTGDGVNDAPALKQADIGIAMGKRGTQVAREAADMILRDDAFSSIAAAIEQGRIIFDNIRTFIRYLISCNVSEILVVFLASVANAPLPILPLQILFLNLVTDVFPALALGLGEGNRLIMRDPPRDPSEPLLTRSHWVGIGASGALIAAAVLGALAIAMLQLGLDENEAVTVSFVTLALAQLWHVFNMRARGSGFLDNSIVRNPFVWSALVLCSVLIVAAIHLPGLSLVLSTRNPGVKGWSLAFGMSLVPLVVGQIALWARGRVAR